LFWEDLHMSDNQMRRTRLECEQLEDRQLLDATTFVTAVYNNLLGRAPDTGGLNFWVSVIQNNGFTNQQVATDIWRSTEHRQDEVLSYYNNFLHRTADAGGLAFWTSVLVNGQLNEQGVETAFLTSNEYVNAHPTPETFIQGLYLNILARFPGANETAFWVNALSTNTAVAVTGSILTSTESFTDIIDRYYTTYLLRTVDASGLDNWLTQLQTGRGTLESVSEGIIGSAEYANVHQ
jgi:hypothetical protein